MIKVIAVSVLATVVSAGIFVEPISGQTLTNFNATEICGAGSSWFRGQDSFFYFPNLSNSTFQGNVSAAASLCTNLNPNTSLAYFSTSIEFDIVLNWLANQTAGPFLTGLVRPAGLNFSLQESAGGWQWISSGASYNPFKSYNINFTSTLNGTCVVVKAGNASAMRCQAGTNTTAFIPLCSVLGKEFVYP
jgi:hypothetical protein